MKKQTASDKFYILYSAAGGCLWHLHSAFALFCLLAGSAISAEELSVRATANRDQIYIGESFILEIVVSGSVGPAEVDFGSLKGANIRSLGSRNISNYSITIVNGKMTREGFTGFISSYEVTPLASGRFQAGPVGVKIDGKLLTDPGPAVTVTDIEKQDRVILFVTASRETALIDEPFSVTLNLKIKCMAGNAAGFEPLFPDNPPALTIPWLDQEMTGLAGPDLRRLLSSYLAPHWNQPGITVNKFTLASDPFDIGSMFLTEPRKAKFALPGKAIQVNGQSYYEYSLQFDYVPKDEGNYVFGPVIFKGGVPERLDEHGRAVGVNIFAVGPACTVRVIPPPDEGRPESYSGAIGSNLTAKTSLDTATCNLGDPLTLTMTVSGRIKLDKMSPPKLSLQTNLLERFTVYDNTVQSVKKGAYNQYLYTIRPTQAGECNIPPIEVAYYDVISRSYKKVFTAPIPLQVRRGAEVTEAQIIGSTNQLIPKKDETDLREKTPAPIRTSAAGARPASLLGSSRIVALAGAGPVLYFAVVLLGFIGRSGRKIKRSRHIHSAKDRAGKCLKAAARIDRKDLPQAVALICKAARKYLGERLNRDPDAITPPETVCILIENGVSKELAEQFGAIYEKYFNAGFTNSRFHGNLPDDCRALQGLIRRIEFELGRRRGPKGSGHRRYLPIIIFFLCVLGGRSVSALDAPERVFIWNEANAIMQAAKTPADYLRAVLIYQRLVDDGVRNGPLFYNIGTALLLADRNELAVDAFERAERYLGRQPDIELNLRIASAKKAKSRQEQLPWYRIAAFWHFYLSCPQRIYIAAWAFLAFWIALVLGHALRFAPGLVPQKMGIKRITSALGLISLVVFIIFATSAAASWQMEASAGRYNFPLQPSPAPTNAPAGAVADN